MKLFDIREKNHAFCFVRLIKKRTFAPLYVKALEIINLLSPAIIC